MPKHVPTTVLCLIAVACGGTAPRVQGAATIEKVWLSDLDVTKTQQGWGEPHRNTSVDGNPMRIAGRQFEHGLGTHADSALYLQLDGRGRKLTGWVGIDDEVGKQGSVEFKILADGKDLYQSGVLKGGDSAKQLDVDISGVKMLVLIVDSGPDGINYDHADWADALLEVVTPRPDTVDGPRRSESVV